MIIFIDIKKYIIFLYSDDSVIQLPFSDIGKLEDYVGNEPLYNVNQIVETTPQEVIGLLLSAPEFEKQPIEDDGKRWIHFTGDGAIVINDIELSLRGKYDIRELNDEMKGHIAKSATLQKMIKQGKFVVINRQQRKALIMEQSKKDIKKREIEDRKIDSMIVKTSVKDYHNNGIQDDNDSIEEIDLNEDIRNIKG